MKINHLCYLINRYSRRMKLFMVMALICVGAAAQTLQQADASYKEFIRLNNTGGDRSSMYSTLCACYTNYLAVLNHSRKGSADYTTSKTALKTIYPYLQNAAGYYSQNNDQTKANFCARAFVDMPLMDAFSGEAFQHDSYYPTIVYFAASNAYNAGDYTLAVKYLGEYLKTGETSKRKTVYGYMYDAYLKAGNAAMAKTILENTVTAYPNDYDVLSLAINASIDAKDYIGLANYVSKALAIRPNDPDLLNIQGKMYEDTRDYESALKVYTAMRRVNSHSLSVTEHVALNTYNLGVMYFNKASLEEKESNAKKLMKTADEYFSNAATIFNEILLSDPTSMKFTQALAIAYSCIGDAKALAATNFKLTALGGASVSSSVAPSLIGFDDKTVNVASAGSARPVASTPVATSTSVDTPSPQMKSSGQVPHFSAFAKEYVESKINSWKAKDQYETLAEYKKRVTNDAMKQKVEALKKEALQEYIRNYAVNITYSDMQLMPYDADNQAFLIRSRYGDMVLPVPREKNEAKIFESNWNGMQFSNPKYYVNGDTLALACLTFTTPTGERYQYDNQTALNYTVTDVDVNLPSIDLNIVADNHDNGKRKQTIVHQKETVGASDVDVNIPEVHASNDKTFAVIIANENYESVSKVAMAGNDGTTFSKYCSRTLGIPETNIRLYKDATFGGMIHAMQDLRNIATAFSGDIQVIFYYAGHGIPDEATKDAYLLPVDADGTQTEVCYSLNKLYSELSTLNARSVVVFLDACFSGSTSDGGNILASARGVALKAKKETPKGNMVVFSAASDAETAFPYQEEGHGLFTYYLLKKLQETKGNVSLKELGTYISSNVKQKSVVINHKSQTPTVSSSAAMGDSWQNMKLR